MERIKVIDAVKKTLAYTGQKAKNKVFARYANKAIK